VANGAFPVGAVFMRGCARRPLSGSTRGCEQHWRADKGGREDAEDDRGEANRFFHRRGRDPRQEAQDTVRGPQPLVARAGHLRERRGRGLVAFVGSVAADQGSTRGRLRLWRSALTLRAAASQEAAALTGGGPPAACRRPRCSPPAESHSLPRRNGALSRRQGILRSRSAAPARRDERGWKGR
jgi:hypothetical protein